MSGAVILAMITCLGVWLYFYTAELPPTTQLKEFNPDSQKKARLGSCDGVEQKVTVLPKGEFGRFAVAALTAAEVRPDTRSPFLWVIFAENGEHVASYQFHSLEHLSAITTSRF